MRDLNELNQYRDAMAEAKVYGALGGRGAGVFYVPVDGALLTVIASSGGGWDHISVSTPNRCPTWGEMAAVLALFRKPHEVWMQLGVPERQHVNCHPHTLHWWRHQRREIPQPPAIFVGPK